ncbi:MAG: hypothetical protein K0U93_30950 [Gammaproteobacteria bacterium]|nr:hypothetical protein [Gammaproteobacteria bacterium]
MKHLHRLTTTFFALLAALAVAPNALAYSTSTCNGEPVKWNSNTVTVRASSTSFPSGTWRNAIDEAVDRINDNPSNFQYNLVTDSGGVALDNGQNEIWGTSDTSLLDGAPAVAYTWWTCYWFFGNVVHMDEVDIIFDFTSPFQWTTSTTKTNLLRYGGTARPIQTTAAHELGHGLKLNHVNTEYNVMGTDFEHIHVNGNTARAYFGEDAADGAVELYGLDNDDREDVAVVHWKYAGASGEYSDHEKTAVYTSDGTDEVNSFDDNGETRYWVSPGQVVQVEFSYENNGATTQSVDVGFYISTNSTISTWDTRIGGTSMTLGRNGVYTTKRTVTIPTTLASATDYWIGAVVDEDDSLGEVAEWNNATYLPIRTPFAYVIYYPAVIGLHL